MHKLGWHWDRRIYNGSSSDPTFFTRPGLLTLTGVDTTLIYIITKNTLCPPTVFLLLEYVLLSCSFMNTFIIFFFFFYIFIKVVFGSFILGCRTSVPEEMDSAGMKANTHQISLVPQEKIYPSKHLDKSLDKILDNKSEENHQHQTSGSKVMQRNVSRSSATWRQPLARTSI